jgi:hypothetical protein
MQQEVAARQNPAKAARTRVVLESLQLMLLLLLAVGASRKA